MDSNYIIENLWHEAVTIRAAVASAYEAVGGDGPLPASLVQALNYITEHAGGGEACGASSTCVPNDDIDALWDAVAGDSEPLDPMPPRDELVGMVASGMVDTIIPRLTEAFGYLVSNAPRLDVDQLSAQLVSGASTVRSASLTLASRMNVEAPKLNASDAMTDAKDGLDVFDADMEAFFGAVGDQSSPFVWDHITADAGKNAIQQTYLSDTALLEGLREGGPLISITPSTDSVGEILNGTFGGE